jgi:excisionase family DNA binding protein
VPPVGGVHLPESNAVARVAFSPREVAEMLGIAPSTLYRYINAGEIPSLKVGGRRFISMSAVNAFVDASRVAPAV